MSNLWFIGREDSLVEPDLVNQAGLVLGKEKKNNKEGSAEEGNGKSSLLHIFLENPLLGITISQS